MWIPYEVLNSDATKIARQGCVGLAPKRCTSNVVAGNRLLERLMSPSPTSQLLCSRLHPHESVIFFRIFGIHTFYATATLLNM